MKRTLETLNRELDELRVRSRKGQIQEGMFGIKACKESIRWNEKYLHQSFPSQYIELIQRGLYEVGFNLNMIVACEELMNEEER